MHIRTLYYNRLAFLPAHDDVIKWKPLPRYWPFVWGIHRSPVNSPNKGPWRRDLMFSLICAWTNDWVNNRDARDLIHHLARYDVTVMNCLFRKNTGRRILHATAPWDPALLDGHSPVRLLPRSMMTSSNGNIFLVTGPLWGEFTGHRTHSSQRPVTQSFDIFFDLRLNKRLSK